MIADFEDSFRVYNLKAVKDTLVLPLDRVRKAITPGMLEGGGTEVINQRVASIIAFSIIARCSP